MLTRNQTEYYSVLNCASLYVLIKAEHCNALKWSVTILLRVILSFLIIVVGLVVIGANSRKSRSILIALLLLIGP